MSEEIVNATKEQLDAHLAGDEISAYDLAQHLKTLKKTDDEAYHDYLEKLDAQSLGDVAIEMPDYMLKDVIETVPHEKMLEALEELESDDATDLLQYIEDIDEDKAKELFDSLDKEDQDEILRLRSYDDYEAGAYMQTELFSARLDERLQTAVERLRKLKSEGELENVSQLFLVDACGVLQYAVPLEDLILFDFSMFLGDIILRSGEKYRATSALDSDDISVVVGLVEDFDLTSIGVTDSKGVLLGRITTDDIHDIIQERATEQIYNLAGVNDEAEEEESLASAGKARAIWLGINLCTAIISSLIIGLFDATIASYVALAVLMPIVASMGGNAGTQSLTVTVRRLALGEIEFKDAKDVVKREVLLSLSNGVLFGLIAGVIAWAWFDRPMLGVVIASSMIINLFSAGFFGTVIPLGLKKFNIDPAVGSSVILTTFTDCIGFFSFLGLAKWILL